MHEDRRGCNPIWFSRNSQMGMKKWLKPRRQRTSNTEFLRFRNKKPKSSCVWSWSQVYPVKGEVIDMNTWRESAPVRRPLLRTLAALLLGGSAILIVAAVEEGERIAGPVTVAPTP